MAKGFCSPVDQCCENCFSPSCGVRIGGYMLDYYRYKDVLELFVNGQTEEAKYLLMELQARHIALTDENSNLKTQVQEYEDILFISKNLLFDGSCYWLMTSGVKQGPFCRDCYSQDGQLIRLVEMPDAWRCPNCNSLRIEDIHGEELLPEAVNAGMKSVRPGKVIPFGAVRH